MTHPLLHSGPAVGFDEPFEMLEACHERVQRSLALLARLIAHVDAHGHDEKSRSAAHDVLRYFELAAPHHHEDEEQAKPERDEWLVPAFVLQKLFGEGQ